MSRGLLGCTDNSPLYCDKSPDVGRRERHRCLDGTVFHCDGGTRGCFDNSPMYCRGKNLPGSLEVHSCADGHHFVCAGGTEGCRDDAPEWCQQLGSLERHTCFGGASVFYCQGGTLGCADDSPLVCGSIPGWQPWTPGSCINNTLAVCIDGTYMGLGDY